MQSRKVQFGIICLSTITPYLAHIQFFNQSSIISLGIFLAVLSVYLLIKNIRFAPLSILLTAFATGIYQVTIQVSLVILIIWFFQQLEMQKPYKNFLLHFFLMGAVIFLGYVLSNAINDAIITQKELTLGGRYKETEEQGLANILQNTISILNQRALPYFLLFYFRPQFQVLHYLLFGLATIALFRRGLLQFYLFILGAIALKLAMNLPYLFLGYSSEPRAFIHVGWAIAGFFALLQQPRQRIFALLSRILCMLIFLFSAVYISQFYDAARRQTESDIQRIHQIVNQIRLMPEYQSEPIPFVIIGEKSFPVTGWEWSQQALNTGWSKYNAFQHFTDFDFRQLSKQEQEQVLSKLSARQGLANYPDKGSSQFVDGTAVLILDISKLPPPEKQQENTEPMTEQKIEEE